MIKVTALIAAFNEAALIRRAIGSLLAQTLADIEVLVIDDGSTDGTAAVVGGIGDDRVRCIRRERGGQAAALAFGCGVAHGEYIARLDADDEAYPERLEKQADFLDRHPDHAWVGCGEERIDARRHEHFDRLYPAEDHALRRQAAKCIPYPHSGIMFRKKLIEQGINYDPAQPYLQDFDLFLRVAGRYKVANLPEVLVRRYERNESFYHGTIKDQRRNRRLAALGARAVREFGLPVWYYAFPLARLCYPWLPDRAKGLARRLQGLKERAAEPAS